ncbi:unnamed protein product, partial [Echinostoma caproni]|uniref:MFS domain-containing protein n=1 Tax=Echinostoma caproni TaxID=27848 RepID=A0A183BA76_9TREM
MMSATWMTFLGPNEVIVRGFLIFAVLGLMKPNNDNDSSKTKRDEVQSATTQLLAFTTMASLVLGVFSSVLMGVISDRYGRSVTIALVLLGQALRFGTIAFMVLFDLSVTIALFVAAICSGLVGGGWIALLVQISVVFTDITRIVDRDADCSNPLVND